MQGGHTGAAVHSGEQHPWWRVMCLTGVDYFSTLGYQPGIAALAAGALSPIATLVLVALTLFGALPVYSRVAASSPNGEGSISMLERLLSYWPSKLLVLVLLGFLATDFIITITLSAADASAHLIENPLFNGVLGHVGGAQVWVTLLLVLLLGAVFLRGFKEATGLAVVLVAAYLSLNAVVVGRGLLDVLHRPELWRNWHDALYASHGSTLAIVGVSLVLFPKLALGLSGFETGVGLMPQIRGDPTDRTDRPGQQAGRIRNTRKLLTSAALIMSVYLVTSSVVSTLLIPAPAFWPPISISRVVNSADLSSGTAVLNVPLDDPNNPQETYTLRLPARAQGTSTVQARVAGTTLPLSVDVEGNTVVVQKPAGSANGRALAYLAHEMLGNTFGTVYDFSTILILWFAGASAMAGLVNVVPRFLPRYGMAPDWTRASRPLVLIYTAIAVFVTLLFRANVDAQGGAYATGVLVLMTSAALAVTLAARRKGERAWLALALVTAVFVYTTIVNMIERPEGLLIASTFIVLILLISLVSRARRSFELRVSQVVFRDSARDLLRTFPIHPLRLVAHHPGRETVAEYHETELRARQMAHLPNDDPFMFLEIEVEDASEFDDVVTVQGVQVGPYAVLRARGSSVPNTIAALLLELRGKDAPPQVYMQWSDKGPFDQAVRFLLEGQGDVPPLTHEILRRAEPDKSRRPIVHAGG